jgi:putative hemolysin
MSHRHIFLSLVILTVLGLVSCTSRAATLTPSSGMPNPSSVYCEENGGILDLRTSESGAVAGVCVFADGSECDEWQFFRGTCKPGDSLLTPRSAPQGESQSAGTSWNTWHNEQLGFSFLYPSDASLVQNDDPLGGLSVIGPLVGDDYWPMFYVSHPTDREEYQPPEGADLAQWLTDHNMIGGQRLADVQIADTTAIHTRKEASPQSFAFDNYYLANSG